MCKRVDTHLSQQNVIRLIILPYIPHYQIVLSRSILLLYCKLCQKLIMTVCNYIHQKTLWPLSQTVESLNHIIVFK